MQYNSAKTRYPLKLSLPGMPQTNEPIFAASEPKFTNREDMLLFYKFFSDCRYMP